MSEDEIEMNMREEITETKKVYVGKKGCISCNGLFELRVYKYFDKDGKEIEKKESRTWDHTEFSCKAEQKQLKEISDVNYEMGWVRDIEACANCLYSGTYQGDNELWCKRSDDMGKRFKIEALGLCDKRNMEGSET